MGYYADGYGFIKFKGVLSEKDYYEVLRVLGEVFEFDGERAYSQKSSAETHTYFDVWCNDKYYGDETIGALEEVARISVIESSEICFIGEDHCYWRFVFENGVWKEEEGDIEYESSAAMKAASAFKEIIATEISRGIDQAVLYKKLHNDGFTDNDIKQLGFAQLIVAGKLQGVEDEIEANEIEVLYSF